MCQRRVTDGAAATDPRRHDAAAQECAVRVTETGLRRAERGKQNPVALMSPGAGRRGRACPGKRRKPSHDPPSIPTSGAGRILLPSRVMPQAAGTGSRRWPGRTRPAMPSTNRQAMSQPPADFADRVAGEKRRAVVSAGRHETENSAFGNHVQMQVKERRHKAAVSGQRCAVSTA